MSTLPSQPAAVYSTSADADALFATFRRLTGSRRLPSRGIDEPPTFDEAEPVSFADELAHAVLLAESGERGHAPTAPGEPTLPLADWIGVMASLVRSQDSDTADWLAAKIDDMASMCRTLSARTTDQYDGRLAAMEEWHGYDEFDRAERQGHAAGLREGGAR